MAETLEQMAQRLGWEINEPDPGRTTMTFLTASGLSAVKGQIGQGEKPQPGQAKEPPSGAPA